MMQNQHCDWINYETSVKLDQLNPTGFLQNVHLSFHDLYVRHNYREAKPYPSSLAQNEPNLVSRKWGTKTAIKAQEKVF